MKCPKCKKQNREIKIIKGKKYICKWCRRCRKKEYGYRRHKISFCVFCGFIPINMCQLDVDHIDGNHKNNAKENLQTLCANCHRLKTFQNR